LNRQDGSAELAERAKFAEFVKTYEKNAPKLATWAEQNIREGLAVFGLFLEACGAAEGCDDGIEFGLGITGARRSSYFVGFPTYGDRFTC
jgi:hypothetical protein